MPLLKTWSGEGARWGIWHTTETEAQLQSLLATDYAPQLKSLKAPSRRLEFLSARVLLKALWGSEPGIAHLPSGKPYLEGRKEHITLSHTRGYAAAGIHPCKEAGIDIEYRSDRVRKVTSRFLHADEMPDAHLLPPDEVTDKLLLQWCAKETLYKMLDEKGVDFVRHLRIFAFPLQHAGTMEAQEFRTPHRQHFTIHYAVNPHFVCTWGVKDAASR